MDDDPSFGALYEEFRELRTVFDNNERWRGLDKAGRESMWRRISDIRTMINTSSPASADDCAVKLRLLLDPGRGMAVGDDPVDLVSLRQVAAFLETRCLAPAAGSNAAAGSGVRIPLQRYPVVKIARHTPSAEILKFQYLLSFMAASAATTAIAVRAARRRSIRSSGR